MRQKITEGVFHEFGLTKEEVISEAQKKIDHYRSLQRKVGIDYQHMEMMIETVEEYRDALLKIIK